MGQRYIEQWTAAEVAALQVRQQEEQYGLFVGTDRVCTPGGRWVAHTRRDIIYAILQEAWVNGSLDVTSGQYFSLYATQHDLLAESFAGFVAQVPHLLQDHEVITRPMVGPEYIEQAWAWRSVAGWLEAHGCTLPFAGTPLDARISTLLAETLEGLHPAQQTAVMSLCFRHQASALLALMVVLGRCTVDEYADGCLIGDVRHPVFGMGDLKHYRTDHELMTRDATIAVAYSTLLLRGA